jgi:hypothetical protein
MGSQSLAQCLSCPVQEHADVIHSNPKLFGDFVVAEVFQASETEDLRLPRIEFAQRLAEVLSQLVRPGCLRRACRPRIHERIVELRRSARRHPLSLAQPVERSGMGQPVEQWSPIGDRLAAREFQGGYERALKTVGCVGIVIDKPADDPPDHRPVLLDDLRPVHEFTRLLQTIRSCPYQLSLEPRDFLQRILSQGHCDGRPLRDDNLLVEQKLNIIARLSQGGGDRLTGDGDHRGRWCRLRQLENEFS